MQKASVSNEVNKFEQLLKRLQVKQEKTMSINKIKKAFSFIGMKGKIGRAHV